MLGEVIFGGVGSGLFGILVFVILAVFIAGLMVGRTPEYLGKKIEAFDVKMAMLSVLITSLTILVFAAIAVVAKFGTSSITNPGPHGLSQILYAYSSGAGNNGSAFAGRANTSGTTRPPSAAMLLGDFLSSFRFSPSRNSARRRQRPHLWALFLLPARFFHFACLHDLDCGRAHIFSQL
jgi:K+-transporting ATPase ATPase A chain